MRSKLTVLVLVLLVLLVSPAYAEWQTANWELLDGIESGTGGGSAAIASGTATLGTDAIASATCASVVTVSATGVATTDVIQATFNADPTSTTGYTAAISGMLTIIAYPTAANVNFKVCNNTGASITPGAVTLNWKVVR